MFATGRPDPLAIVLLAAAGLFVVAALGRALRSLLRFYNRRAVLLRPAVAPYVATRASVPASLARSFAVSLDGRAAPSLLTGPR